MFKTIKPALFALCCLAIVSCKKDIVEENALPTEGNIKNSSVDPNKIERAHV